MLSFTGEKLPTEEMAFMKKASDFGINWLLTPQQQKTVNVTINLFNKKGTLGECVYLGKVDNRKVFDVKINLHFMGRSKKLERKMESVTTCLFHELIHVKQYATNSLFDYVDGTVRFNGVRYNVTEHNVTTKPEYWESPWEWEAYGGSKCLWELFLIKMREV